MGALGLTTWIWKNRMKTILLLGMFPLMLFTAIYGTLVGMAVYSSDLSWSNAHEGVFPQFIELVTILVPVICVWFLVSLWLHKKIVFGLTHATPLERKENPAIYNMVENLCISRGIPMPRVAVISDSGMNAFATGWSVKDSWVVFTSGLVEALTPAELEAVAAHEITHIRNRDVQLMTIIVIFIGIISWLGIWMMYIRRDSDSRNNFIPIIGIVLYVLSIIFMPLIQLAVSRKREFLADAGAVELTKNSAAMISALEKISQRPQVESLKGENVRNMCIISPVKKLMSLFQTHPPVEDRIKALKNM